MMSRKVLLLAFVVAAVVIFAVHSLDFPGSVPNFIRLSGGGTLLDVKPSFSVEQTYLRLAQYGEAGRKNYAFRNLTIDVVLPLSVLPFFFLLMIHALKRATSRPLLRATLLSIPMVYVVFDFVENALVLILIAHFPDRMTLLAGLLPYVTVVKRAGSILALLVPLVIFVISLVRRFSVKMHPRTTG